MTISFNKVLASLGAHVAEVLTVPPFKSTATAILGCWSHEQQSVSSQVWAERALSAWRRLCVSLFALAGALVGAVFSTITVGVAGLFILWAFSIPLQLAVFA